MVRAEIATPSLTTDFWPADSLSSWQSNPASACLSWLAEYRVGMQKLRKSSCDTYLAMFSTWVSFLSNRGLHLLEATPADVAVFFERRDKAFEAVSRRRYLQLLDKIYRHLQQVGWRGTNPLLLEFKKEGILDIELPPGLSDEDQVRLQAKLSAIPGWKGARDRGMAAVMWGAGLRTNEVISTEISQVRLAYAIRVEPIGVHRPHTTLVMPDGPWREWLDAWLAVRTAMQIPGALLCPATSKGEPYSPSGLYRRISGWFVAAGASSEKRNANILRNTFARTALACGRYSLADVQEFLGHEDSRATARYAGPLDELLC